MARAGGWEFFLTRWGLLYDAVAGSVKAAAQTQPQLTQSQAAKLDVLIKKAIRAKEVLQQLQDAEQRHVQLHARYAPLVAQLPQPQAATPDSAAAAHSSRGCMPLKHARAEPEVASSSAPTQPAAQRLDPFGIHLATSAALALVTWRDLAAGIRRTSAAAEALLSGPNMTELARFSLERRTLVRELQSVAAQLHKDVELPPLTPLDHECAALDTLLTALRQVQETHLHTMQQELSSLNLPLLELKLSMRSGQDWRGSDAHAALAYLQTLLAAMQQGRALPPKAWEGFEEHLQALQAAVQAQQQQESQLGQSEQQYLRQLYARLSRWQSTTHHAHG